MSTLGSDNKGEIRDLLNRHLSGETSAEEKEQVRNILTTSPEAAEEFRRMEEARALLRRAVAAEPIPDSLHGAVRRCTVDAEEGSGEEDDAGAEIDFGVASIIIPPHAGDNADDDAGAEIDFGVATIITPPHSRQGRTYRRYYAVAAVLLLLVAGWFVLRQRGGDDVSGSGDVAGTVDTEGRSPISSADSVREILRIGMNDHLQCAVAFHRDDPPEYDAGEMQEALGEEFAGLIPVMREKITEGKLLAAHRCTVGGREFVHMIVRGEGKLISVAVTRKEGGEWLTGHEGAAAVSAAVPVYRAAMDGFEVAGFESGAYFVFVASDLSEQANLQVALNVAEPVSGVLAGGKQL